MILPILSTGWKTWKLEFWKPDDTHLSWLDSQLWLAGYNCDWLATTLIDWLQLWLAGYNSDWLAVTLIGWLYNSDWLAVTLIGWLYNSDWLAVTLIGWLYNSDWLAVTLIGWLYNSDWLAVTLIGWLYNSDWLAVTLGLYNSDWLATTLIGWLYNWLTGCNSGAIQLWLAGYNSAQTVNKALIGQHSFVYPADCPFASWACENVFLGNFVAWEFHVSCLLTLLFSQANVGHAQVRNNR